MYRATESVPRRAWETTPTSNEFWIKPARKKKARKQNDKKTVASPGNVTTKEFTAREPFRFLDLPAECRNRIYEYVFAGPHFVVELMPPAARYIIQLDAADETNENYKVLRCDIRNLFGGSLKDRERRLIVNWSSSISGLHVVSQQLYCETMFYLYSTPTFCLQSMKATKAFMKIAQHNQALQFVRSLFLGLQAYGQPRAAKNRIFATNYHEATSRNIIAMAERMPNVRKFSILVEVKDNPLVLTFRQQWVQPLLSFSHFRKAKDIRIQVLIPHVAEEIYRDEIPSWHRHYIAERSAYEKEVYYVTKSLQTLFGIALSRRVLGFCESCACEQMYMQTTDEEYELCRRLKELKRVDSDLLYENALDWSWINHEAQAKAPTTAYAAEDLAHDMKWCNIDFDAAEE